MGSVTNAMAAPSFGVYAFGPQADGQGDTVSFDYFTLDGADGDPCECVPGPGDEFDGGALDTTTKWNAIVREDESLYELSGGALRVTTVGGDIYTNGNPEPTRNFILQDAPAGDWVIETKVSGNISGGYEQGGLLVYVDDDNYIKYDLISDDGQTVKNRIELRSEVNGAIVEPQPQVADLNVDAAWLRLTEDRQLVRGRVLARRRELAVDRPAGHEQHGRAEVRPIHARRQQSRRDRRVRLLQRQRPNRLRGAAAGEHAAGDRVGHGEPVERLRPAAGGLRRHGDGRRRRHAHLQLGLRRRRHRGLHDRGSVAHLHRAGRLRRRGDGVRR